jgi:hypothetical protein
MIEYSTIAIAVAVLGFLLTAGTAVVKIVMNIHSSVDTVKKDAATTSGLAIAKADLVSNQLSDYRLHVAETFVSKHDMHAALAPLMDSVQGVKGSVDNLAARVDRVIEMRAPSAPPRRTHTD